MAHTDKPHHYETWLYSLKGTRKQLYKGTSESAAKKARDLAVLVIEEYGLDAAIVVSGCSNLDTLITPVQTDYFDGWRNTRRDPHDITLVLEEGYRKRKVKSRCLLCNGSGQLCDICGEAETACECDEKDEPTFSDCTDCKGTGE